MGERIAKPAAGGFQLAALVQHDEIAAGGYIFSHPLGCRKYTRALQVAGGRATAEIMEHRETLATSDGPQIPGVAGMEDVGPFPHLQAPETPIGLARGFFDAN